MLAAESGISRRIFPEKRTLVGNSKRSIIGDIDYTIGAARGLNRFSRVTSEAKVDWWQDDYWQFVAEAGYLITNNDYIQQ